jgi:hypothetical protein
LQTALSRTSQPGMTALEHLNIRRHGFFSQDSDSLLYIRNSMQKKLF